MREWGAAAKILVPAKGLELMSSSPLPPTPFSPVLLASLAVGGRGGGGGRKQTAHRFFSNSGGKSLVTKCMQQTVLCYADRGLNTIILNLNANDPTIKTGKKCYGKFSLT